MWGEKEKKFWIEYTGVAKTEIDMSDVNMKDNRNRYNEGNRKISEYGSVSGWHCSI